MTPAHPSLDDLRRYAVARTMFAPTTLGNAIKRLGFVQADPLRAPARAQDLTLRHRVKNYAAGDLERRYPALAIEEAFFVNYGFLTRDVHALMHPAWGQPPLVQGDSHASSGSTSKLTAHEAGLAHWPVGQRRKATALLEFVQERGVVHPREVDAHFAHGRVLNWFGGTSSASTQLLDALHRAGQLRIAKRENGVRTYGVAVGPTIEAQQAASTGAQTPDRAMDALVDVIVGKYAPLPEASLRDLVGRLRGGVPHWADLRAAAFQRAKLRLGHATVDGIRWFWPVGESPLSKRCGSGIAREKASAHGASGGGAPGLGQGGVCLLAPFDPLVWDRRRFELLWGWAYRFEAYTPAAKRVRGHYSLPLLWQDRVIGWGNLAVVAGRLSADLGYVSEKPPAGRAYKMALEQELAAMQVFLGLAEGA